MQKWTGSGSVFRPKGRTRYYYEFTFGGKVHRKSLKTDDWDEACQRAARISAPLQFQKTAETYKRLQLEIDLAEQEVQVYVTPLVDVWQKFLASGEHVGCRQERDWRNFLKWIRAHQPGILNLSDLRREHMLEYRTTLAAQYSASTVNRKMMDIRRIFNTLDPECPRERDPFYRIRNLSSDPRGRRNLTLDEIGTLVSAAEGELRTLLAIGIYTGLRLGDAITLQWEQIDQVRGIIRLEAGKNRHRKARPVFIAVHPALAALLKNVQPDPAQRKGYVLPEFAGTYTGRAGPPHIARRLRLFFDAHLQDTRHSAEGYARHCAKVGFHSLRHSFATICAEQGVPRAAVQAVLGHSTNITDRVYTHVGIESLARSMRALPNVLGVTTAADDDDPVSRAIARMDDASDEDWRDRWRELRTVLRRPR